MADTTIRVSTEVRDRLAALAREQGTTIRDLMTDLAGARLTREELAARGAAARVYVREHFADLADEDFDKGQQLLDDIAAGRTTVLG